MGNNRKVWLACGAAVGLPLSGLAQDVRQVQVSKSNGHVEIHVIGTNLPKPGNVIWKSNIAYTLEWKAGLKARGGRIRVDSGNVRSVWYGWFSSNPHTMRVQVLTKPNTKPTVKQDSEGWVITIDDSSSKTLAIAPVKAIDNVQAKVVTPPLLAPKKPGKKQVVALDAPSEVRLSASTQELPIEASHKKMVSRPTNVTSDEKFPDYVSVVEPPPIIDTPAMKKWAVVEQLDKAQIKHPAVKPDAPKATPPVLLAASHPTAMVMTPSDQVPLQSGMRKVTLDCSNADLTQVLKGLAMQSGANIVIGPSVTGKVTADLHDVTIDQALKYVAYLTGIRYEKVDGIYIFGMMPLEKVATHTNAENVVKVVPILSDSSKEIKAVLEAKYRGQDLQILTPADSPSSVKKDPSQSTQSVVNPQGGSSSLVMPESYVILIGPADVVDEAQMSAKSVDVEIVRAHHSYETTERIDKEFFAYDVKFSDPRSLREALITEIPGLRVVVAPNTVGTFSLYQDGKLKKQSNEDNSQASSQGQNGGGESQSQPTTGATSTTSKDEGSLDFPFTTEEGVSVPMKLILKGTKEQIEQAMEYLRMLDTPPHQVALELRVMELTRQDALNAGIDWNILTGGAVKVLNLNNSQANPNNSASVSISGKNFNGDVTASLDALGTKNKILSRPNMVAMDGRQSEIFIGDIIRYVQSITNSQNGPSITTGEVPVGIRLSVLPRVGANGNMTLDLRNRVSLLTSFTQVSGGGELPQTSSRLIGNTISLQSGQTIAIGGLIQDQDIKTLSGIPGLMNLPFLGSLFRSTTLSKQRTELVIFLTAKSLDGPVGSQEIPMLKDSAFVKPDPMFGKGGKN